MFIVLLITITFSNRVEASYVFTKLFDFDGTIYGSYPSGSLIQASDGKLYGMTFSGGANDVGTIFSYNITTGSTTKLFDFDEINGSNPYGSLIQVSDGKLYGMTYNGGTNSLGVFFEFTISTTTTLKHHKTTVTTENSLYVYYPTSKYSFTSSHELTLKEAENRLFSLSSSESSPTVTSQVISTTTTTLSTTTLESSISTPKDIEPIKKLKSNLFFGSSGTDVKILQEFLINQNKGTSSLLLKNNGTTNYFGKLTQSALSEWQLLNDIKPSNGYFGPKTRAVIENL